MKRLALVALVACGGSVKMQPDHPAPPRVVIGPESHEGQVWLAGFAQNAKLGAVVDARGLVVRCDGKDAWPDDLVGKPVLVAGILGTRRHPPLPVGPGGERSAGAEGEEQVLFQCSQPKRFRDPELVPVEEAIFAALAKRDREGLGKIVAHDFLLRMPGQPEIGKGAFLEAAAAIPGEILEVRGEGVTAQRAGDVGIVQGQQIARVRVGGQVLVDRGHFLDVFVRRDGRWVMTFALTTPENP